MSFASFATYEALRLLKQCQAVIDNDHFVYASGKHGSAYINKNAVLDDPQRLKGLCNLMMCIFADDVYDVVVGPESGGIKIADGVAASACDRSGPAKRIVTSYHAMKTGSGGFDFGLDDYIAIRGRTVLVVEDVLTTGASCRKVVELVRKVGGNVIGVGAFVNRGSVTAEQLGNVPQFVSLVDLPLQSWEEHECPMCKAGVPVRTDLGKGKAFLESKQKIAP